MKLVIFVLVLSLSFVTISADDIEKAPQSFAVDGSMAVFVDFTKKDVALHLDVKGRKATATTKINFYQPRTGFPLLDLIPNIEKIKVNGKEVSTSLFKSVSAPDSSTTLRMVKEELTAGHHVLEISHTLSSTNISFSSAGVKLAFFMSDLSRRRFLEQYIPANLEYDQYATSMKIKIAGASYLHRVMTNGKLQSPANNEFTIDFPSYFTASSYYLHIVDTREMTILEDSYQGLEKTIPLVVYAKSKSLANSGMRDLKKIMKELEGTFGPYAHESFVAYMTSGGGGMEYCGATATSLWALGHEITHSWFARGVMPSSGNSGWMDEAIASWRDKGYPRPSSLQNRPGVNLAGFSQYRRHTPYAAYSKGMTFISELDYIFRNHGGMKQQLKNLFAKHKRSPITTEKFQQFLQSKTKFELLPRFDKFVYGKGVDMADVHPEDHKDQPCRPFTKEELEEIL